MSHHVWDIVLAGLLIASWVALVCVAAFPLVRRPDPVPTHPPAAKEMALAEPPPPRASPTPPTLALHLMCGDHKHEIARVRIPSHTRRPSFIYEGQVYLAAHRRTNGDWEYRWIGKS
jgi:hypothetical protein